MTHSLKERNKEKQVQFIFFPVTSLYISKIEGWVPRREDAEGEGGSRAVVPNKNIEPSL